MSFHCYPIVTLVPSLLLILISAADLTTAGKIENILLNPSANSIISPLSIQSTLIPLLLGSDGETKQELTEFLKNEFDSIESGDGSLSPALQVQGQQINSVTALFTSLPLTRFFVKATTSRNSKTRVHLYENFNFSKNSGDINTLVNSATNGLIDNIVQEGSLGDETKLIIVNAVHFKAKWRQPFDSISALQPFHTSEELVTQIPMMTQRSTNYYGVVPELQSKVVEIPYENAEFVMRIILPDDPNGLPKVLEILKTFDYNKLKLKLTEVDIILPKFRISNELDLGKTLKNNGLPTLFSPKAANLTKLAIQGRFSNEGNLFVDKLISKAIVDVGTIGTEGGSATAAFIVPLSGLQTFTDFVADHPFVFQIISTKEKSTIFSGTFYKPPPLGTKLNPNPRPTAVDNVSSSAEKQSLIPSSSTTPKLDTKIEEIAKKNSTSAPPLSQQLTFYLKPKPTNASKTETTQDATVMDAAWWVHTGKPVYLLPQQVTATNKPPAPPNASGNQTAPRFQQPEPTHATGIRFPFPLTDPTTLFVIATHHRNTTSSNTI